MDTYNIIELFLKKEFVKNSDAKYQAKMFRNKVMDLWSNPNSLRAIDRTLGQVKFLETIRKLELEQVKDNNTSSEKC